MAGGVKVSQLLHSVLPLRGLKDSQCKTNMVSAHAPNWHACQDHVVGYFS